jgi:hypothetical protein
VELVYKPMQQYPQRHRKLITGLYKLGMVHDWKKPAILKDATGNVIDVRQLRAEAAARRLAVEAAASAAAIPTTSGLTVAGEKVDVATTSFVDTSTPAEPQPPISKRKTKVGSKYSRLKGSSAAFLGSANQMHHDSK